MNNSTRSRLPCFHFFDYRYQFFCISGNALRPQWKSRTYARSYAIITCDFKQRKDWGSVTGIPPCFRDYRKRLDSFPFQLNVHTLVKHFPPHRHDFFEFSLVMDGSGSETIDGVTHSMEPGTFTFVMPYQVHEIHVPPGGQLRMFNCNFGMELLFGVNTHYKFTSFLLNTEDRLSSFIKLDDDSYQYLHSFLNSMQSEYINEQMWVKELLLVRLTEVLILFDRHRRRKDSAIGPITGASQAANKINIWNILHYIHHHYQEDITLTSVSEHFHLNPSYLSLLFTKHTGQSFMKHLHEMRIRHSYALLQSTEMSILEIAFEVGYGSYNAFTRIFKQLNGISPSDYRKKAVPV
jgi:AraC-like DNA-binding protein/mannose-6-phosphate isomerase-like protein (cupin superfamily)